MAGPAARDGRAQPRPPRVAVAQDTRPGCVARDATGRLRPRRRTGGDRRPCVRAPARAGAVRERGGPSGRGGRDARRGDRAVARRRTRGARVPALRAGRGRAPRGAPAGGARRADRRRARTRPPPRARRGARRAQVESSAARAALRPVDARALPVGTTGGGPARLRGHATPAGRGARARAGAGVAAAGGGDPPAGPRPRPGPGRDNGATRTSPPGTRRGRGRARRSRRRSRRTAREERNTELERRAGGRPGDGRAARRDERSRAPRRAGPGTAAVALRRGRDLDPLRRRDAYEDRPGDRSRARVAEHWGRRPRAGSQSARVPRG